MDAACGAEVLQRDDRELLAVFPDKCLLRVVQQTQRDVTLEPSSPHSSADRDHSRPAADAEDALPDSDEGLITQL